MASLKGKKKVNSNTPVPMKGNSQNNGASRGARQTANAQRSVASNNGNKLVPLNVKKTEISIGQLCAVKPTSRDVPVVFDMSRLLYHAAAIVMKINAHSGYIPTTGDGINPGMIALYLTKAYAAYQIRCGVWKTDYDDIPSMNNLCVPAYVATLFQGSCRILDPVTKAELRFIDSSYDTNMRALTHNEGYATTLVANGTVGSTKEQIFDAGTVLTYSSLTSLYCQKISDYIMSVYPSTVMIEKIPTSCSSYYLAIGNNGSCFKPVTPFALQFSLQTGALSYLPCTSVSYPISRETISAMIWAIEDSKFDPNATLNSYAKRVGINPWKVGVSYTQLSWSLFCEICFQLLKRQGSITTATAGANAWAVYVNYTALIFTGYYSHLSWPARIAASMPGYVSKAMRGINTLPCLAQLGGSAFIVDSNIIVPYYACAQSNQIMLMYQPSATTTATFTVALSRNNCITGTVPSSFFFAGQLVLSPSAVVNIVPLSTLDSLISVVQSASNAYLGQGTIITSKPTCPCWSTRSASNNDFSVSSTVGAEFLVVWSYASALFAVGVMDNFSCLCISGAGMLHTPAGSISRFFDPTPDNAGDTIELIIDAGMRDSAFENWSAANGKKNPGESLLSYFRERLLDTVNYQHVILKPDNLISLAKFAQQNGVLPTDINPEAFRDLRGEWDLQHLVAAAAAAAVKYGPSIWNLIRGNREIRARVEL